MRLRPFALHDCAKERRDKDRHEEHASALPL